MKPHKYNVSPAEERRWNGHTYDSKAECIYAQQLDMLRNDGEVVEFVEQPRVTLGVPENVYRPDFFVVTRTEVYYVDVKGMETPAFRHNKKLWAKYGRHPLHIVKREGKKFKLTETIEPE